MRKSSSKPKNRVRRIAKILAHTLLFSCLTNCVIYAQTSSSSPVSVKSIAVTIDDLPLNGPPIGLNRLRKMTRRILSPIRAHSVPVVGFVNESQLYVDGETDDRINILADWANADVELANHTYSHLGFKDTPLHLFQDDFVRGDTVIKRLMKEKGRAVRYFRHPYLQMGPTVEIESSFERFLADRGYRNAPVTVDSMDWMFLFAYTRARRQNDRALKVVVSHDYLTLVERRLQYAERLADEMFGRPVSHILLLHSNELNADHLAELLDVIKTRGYRFITLEEALKDEIYRDPPKYAPTSDWMHRWSYSLGKPNDPPPPPDYVRRIFDETQRAK
jgi:peptidoglycan-N-acetylglucosamine deacetylase